MNEFKGALAGLAVRVKNGGVAALAVTRGWAKKPGMLIAAGVGVILVVGLISTLVHANSLTGQLVAETGKFDRAIATLDSRTVELATVTGDLRAAEGREAKVAATEADQNLRSAKLDARETAVQGAEDVAAANTIPGSGTFRVGIDVQPGQYHSEGGSSCYWSRMNAAGDDTIDNYIGSGPAVLTVQPSDGLIKTSRCAPFTKSG